jgi:putative transposase
MSSGFVAFFLTVRSLARSRAALQLEPLALRHQLQVARAVPFLTGCASLGTDRVLWVWVSRLWKDWRRALLIVKPDTVIAWHRKGFRLFWTWKGRRRLAESADIAAAGPFDNLPDASPDRS